MSATPKGTSSNTAFVFNRNDAQAQNNQPEPGRKVYFPPLPDAKKLKDKQKVKPLSKEFFIELIKLETDFHQKNFTVETIDELTQYYARAVEYYDSIKDNIASYFLFKIQDTLATKQSLRLLIEQNKIQKRGSVMPVDGEDPFLRAAPKKNTIEERSDESDEEKDVKPLPKPAKKKESVLRLSYSQLKNEKAKFVNQYVNIDNKIEEEAHSEKTKTNDMVNNYAENSDRFDKIINVEIDDQKEKIRKKLEEKKAKKRMEATLNSTQISGVMNTTFDKILDGLDEPLKFNSDNKFNKSEFSAGFDSTPDLDKAGSDVLNGSGSNPVKNRNAYNVKGKTPEIKGFDVSNENENGEGRRSESDT